MIGPKSVLSQAAGAMAPKVFDLAPGVTVNVVRQALHLAIVGVGPLPGAAVAADRLRGEHGDDVDRAVRHAIESHVRLASIGGFATNLGGLVTSALTLPANISGMAIIQCRLVATIAHLRGHDLTDPRVRNAVLVTLLGEDKVDAEIKRMKLPAPPMAIATAPAYDAALDNLIATAVATELLGRVAGKRVVASVGKRIPVVGGVVGAGADAWATLQIGRYASREILARRKG